MERLRTRNEIMAWLEEHAPYPSIRRAVVEGTTELLGVFNKMSPTGTTAWIVKVISKYDKVWYVAIIPDSFHHCFRCHATNEPSWEYWAGDLPNLNQHIVNEKLDTPLYMGDNPEKYKELKNEAKNKASH